MPIQDLVDCDAARFRVRRPGQADRQQAVVEPGIDKVGVDPGRQRGAIREAATAPRAATDDAGALALVDLAADDQLGVGYFDYQLAELFAMQRWLVEARKLISPQRDMMASLVSGMVELPGTTATADARVETRA